MEITFTMHIVMAEGLKWILFGITERLLIKTIFQHGTDVV
jgi:hypothetical protein